MSRLSSWGYPKGEPLKVIKLPNKIVSAIQSAKARLSGDEFIRLLNSEANQDRDSWQTIPLSKVIELSLLLRSDFEESSDYSLAELSGFNPFLGVSVDKFLENTIDNVVSWDMPDDYKTDYIAFIVDAYAKYLELVEPMVEALVKVDPFTRHSSIMCYDPTCELFKYSLVFDDIKAVSATTAETLAFMFSRDSHSDGLEYTLDDAVRANEPGVLSAIGLNNGGYGEDRYQWLIDQRKKTLGTVNYDFLEWSKNRGYADRIHPLLHKVTSKESLDIIKACLTEIQFSGFSRAFGNAEVQNHKEREVGNAFRQWWRIRESSPDTKIILEDVLGVDINKLLYLGIEQKECHKLLGITGNATKTEINQAYRQLAKVHHPDKGGDAEMMKKLNRAKAEALAA